jgi:hypothetical protein
MKLKFLLLAFYMLVFVSCEDKNENEEPKFDKNQAIKEIKSALSSWSSASQIQNSTQMYRLSYDIGNFEGMTDVCKETWDRGLTLNYILSSVVVT